MNTAKFFILLGIFASVNVWADAISPDLWDIYHRAKLDPKTYERADQFCAGKRIGDACEMPGNRFDGGGKGDCAQEVNPDEKTIDAYCKQAVKAHVVRELPPGGYGVAPAICDMAKNHAGFAEDLRSANATCEIPPPISDRFCSGKALGALCVVEIFGGQETYSGRCRMGDDRRWIRAPAGSGKKYVPIFRPAILCQSENPVERTFVKSSPPWW